MKFTWTTRLTALTPLFMLLAILTAGGGHGFQLPTLVLYPIMFLFSAFSSGGWPFSLDCFNRTISIVWADS